VRNGVKDPTPSSLASVNRPTLDVKPLTLPRLIRHQRDFRVFLRLFAQGCTTAADAFVELARNFSSVEVTLARS